MIMKTLMNTARGVKIDRYTDAGKQLNERRRSRRGTGTKDEAKQKFVFSWYTKENIVAKGEAGGGRVV